MNDVLDQSCPLCQAPAKYTRIDFQHKHFKCQSCNEFVISRAGEQMLPNRAVTTLQAFAKNACATTNPDLIYVISGPLPGSAPHIDLQGESQPRSTALVG